jgi:acid stress chaperone HdeA
VAEVLSNKGKVEDAVLDVDGIASVTPELVQACTQEPKSSFMEKLKAVWSKLK